MQQNQADRADGRRILAALPRLGRGEGWVWAPSHSVLAQVAFPPIRIFDSSGAPVHGERVQASGPRPPVDLAALAAALGEADVNDAGFDGDGYAQVLALHQRLRQGEQELAAALARIAELEAPLQADGRLYSTNGFAAVS